MANDIVWFDDTEVGAPVLNNAAGSLDAILYACLVTGFNPKSGLAITVTSNVAFVTLAGHGYTDQKMVDIAGAATGSINGRKLVTVTGSGAFNFPAPGVADGAISGSITAKRSPLGWVRNLNSGNVSIYTRSDVAATGMALRVDDSGAGVASATSARAIMVESYADLNTYSGPAPTAVQLSGGQYWSKGANSTTAKKWLVVGDGRCFYLFTESSGTNFSSSGGLQAAMFGDMVSYRAGDTYGCCISGGASADAQSPAFSPGTVGTSASSAGFVWSRLSTLIGAATFAGAVAAINSSPMGGNASTLPPYPSPVDNGAVFAFPLFLSESSATFTNPIRGQAPGVAVPLIRGLHVLHGATLNSVVGFSGRMLIVGLVSTGNSGNSGACALDVTGPWR